MIEITIGRETRNAREITLSWLRRSIEKKRHAGAAVCVKIKMRFRDVDMILATPGCLPSGVRKEEANPEELQIIEAWRKKGLNTENFSVHDLEEFLLELKRRS